MEKPPFVKIPKGSSLQEIAQLFDLEEGYIRRYHNIYCDYEDLIEIDIPKHLVKIYLPPKDENFKKNFLAGRNAEVISPEKQLGKIKSFQKEYGIEQTLYEDGQEPLKISYLIEVIGQKHQYTINRKSIYINHKAPDSIAEQLSDKIGTMFFPLEVECFENGNLKSITNIEGIRSRWKTLRVDLQKYYQGEVADKLIARLDNEMKNKSLVQNKILNSLFYRLYFMPFRNGMVENFDLYLPVFPHKNKVKYTVDFSVEPELSETGKILLQITGECTDKRNYSQIINNQSPTVITTDSPTKGHIEALYKINGDTGTIFSINAEIYLENEDQQKSKKIIFELYEQIKE